MDAMTENSIRLEQVESLGRLVAGFSHDMKNHLGIIRESNGLMDDIIEMGGLSEDETTVERFKKAISSIERRVVIAANMLHHLSSLAHRPDRPYSSFRINELVTEEYVFLERFSRLQQIDIALELGEGLPAVYNEPSLLQHVFYRLYLLCLEQLNAADSLVIITGQDKKNAVITFRLIGNPQASFEQLSDDTLSAAIKKLGGILETGESTKEYSNIRLTIPSLPIE